MAAEDVASGVARVAVGLPVNGIIEIAGPEQFRVDELVRRRLASLNDPREVVADPHARYSGAEVSERTLLPGKDARLGETRSEEHTSELQSRLHLVCRLLLEKKKKMNTTIQPPDCTHDKHNR